MTEKPSNLSVDLLTGLTSGIISSFCASPFVTIVDRSIIRNANRSLNLYKGLSQGYKQLFTNLRSFYGKKQVYYVWFVYASTYSSSNMSQSVCDHFQIKSDLPQLALTVSANFLSTIIKDNYIARTYGKVKDKRFSRQSLGFFILRDISAMGFGFTVPQYVSKFLHQFCQSYMSESTMRYLTQLIFVPLAIITFSTPMQLLGLDCFNSPQNNFNQRIDFLQSTYLQTCSVAYLRFLPLYGLGGSLNIFFLQKFQSHSIPHE